jgi:hypothetical protein
VGGAREPRSPEGSTDWLIYAASRAGIATDELIPKHGVGPRGGIGTVRGLVHAKTEITSTPSAYASGNTYVVFHSVCQRPRRAPGTTISDLAVNLQQALRLVGPDRPFLQDLHTTSHLRIQLRAKRHHVVFPGGVLGTELHDLFQA